MAAGPGQAADRPVSDKHLGPQGPIRLNTYSHGVTALQPNLYANQERCYCSKCPSALMLGIHV